MESTLSNIRTGRISSSEIVALTKNGKPREMTIAELSAYKKKNPKSTNTKIVEPGEPFYTYVEHCRMERFFKKSLDHSGDVFAFSWGKLCEKIVHEKLSTKYVFQSDVTLVHPKIPDWVGTPDGFINVKHKQIEPGVWIVNKAEVVTDIKCPTSLQGFYNLIKPIYEFDGFNVVGKKEISGEEIIKQIRALSKEGDKYYWQLVSNACITGAKYAELIVYMPYFEELDEIKAYNLDLSDPNYTIDRKILLELPFIPKESGIDNLNVIRFEVPKEDKEFLTERVLLAVPKIDAA